MPKNSKKYSNRPYNPGDILKRGGVGVILTDTIYGIAGPALNRKTVERIYRLKKRRPDKPLIILISSYADLKKFGVKPSPVLKRFWPGKVSIILPAPSAKFRYLHRGTKTLAFRLPQSAKLRAFLRKTGPLVAPSANPEGLPPARDIKEAEMYFGPAVDFYMDGGRRNAKPSKLVKIEGDKIEIFRR